MSCSGFFLVDKPAGPTSNRVLQDIKRAFGKASPSLNVKFGHAGTLDSFASGLLIVLAGKCTRLTPWFMHQTKEYEAVFRFGEETDTLDPLGKIIGHAEPPSRDMLERAIPRFKGNILQIPPSYSAVHIAGQRSYKIARDGETPELEPRPVVIESLGMHSYDGEEAHFSIRCSSGTYIRALARDIAQVCGSRAFVKSLRRTRSGPFSVDAALRPDMCSAKTMIHFTSEVALSLGLGAGLLSPAHFDRFLHGSDLPLSAVESVESAESVESRGKALNCSAGRANEGSPLALFSKSGTFLGIVRKSESGWAVKVMAADEAEK